MNFENDRPFDIPHTYFMRLPFEKIIRTSWTVLAVIGLMGATECGSASAASDTPGPLPQTTSQDAGSSPGWRDSIMPEWGGHLKARGYALKPDKDSIYGLNGTGTDYDGSLEGRLKGGLLFGDWGYFETHYEIIYSAGDTIEKGNQLQGALPDLPGDIILFRAPLNDDRRLLNLSSIISEGDRHVLYHRLDRLAFTLMPEWGAFTIGRQAVTWGNGLIFNPMDLFNPFAPTDIEREYKIGDDMISAQFPAGPLGDLHLLYVARRDPDTGNTGIDRNSLAGKLHFASGSVEFDVMGARHYSDTVVGLGSAGYLGSTAWRLDATLTLLDRGYRKDSYLSFVANMDYSWVWWGKNLYGFLEFYYNGLGGDDYLAVLSDPNVLERLARGELFTLGRPYLSGHIRLEVHPLFNVYMSVINNLGDPSGVLQPRAVWDMLQDVQITFGGNFVYGAKGTEYGGIEIPGTDLTMRASNSAFVWAAYYF
ncbi:MAG: hypothetical protein JRK53_01710 [Deltaproteobacteria bacterium]|nr:hypothetical protein [Deltaproteobacteria bacterium]MBW2283213.1 hypothetical protein [Deltaproteobacteria bacterium]